MLLKIAEKIVRRNVFELKKKKPGLSANKAFEQLHPLASVFSDYKDSRTTRYHKPSKPFHNGTQFK